MLKSRTKEDQLLVQIGAMIGHLEERRSEVEMGELGGAQIEELAGKVEAAWKALCRRGSTRV